MPSRSKIRGIGSVDDPSFQLHGAWAPFQETQGAFKGETAYYDQNGTEWAGGTGPIVTDQFANPTLVGGNLQPAFSPTTIATDAPVPPGGSIFGAGSSIESMLTGSLFGGIPNWVLLLGVAGAFYFFSMESSHGRH